MNVQYYWIYLILLDFLKKWVKIVSLIHIICIIFISFLNFSKFIFTIFTYVIVSTTHWWIDGRKLFMYDKNWVHETYIVNNSIICSKSSRLVKYTVVSSTGSDVKILALKSRFACFVSIKLGLKPAKITCTETCKCCSVLFQLCFYVVQ